MFAAIFLMTMKVRWCSGWRDALEGRWFEPGLGRRVVTLEKKLYFTLSLFTQVYKWVPATEFWRSPCDGLPCHPRGINNTPICFMLQKSGLSPGRMALPYFMKPIMAVNSVLVFLPLYCCTSITSACKDRRVLPSS